MICEVLQTPAVRCLSHNLVNPIAASPNFLEQAVTLPPNAVALLYLAASVFFILALRGLSHPESARQPVSDRAGMAVSLAQLSYFDRERLRDRVAGHVSRS